MPIQPNQQTNGFNNAIPVGGNQVMPLPGVNNQGWVNPWYPQAPQPQQFQQMTYPLNNQQPINYNQAEQTQTPQQETEEGPTLMDLMNSIQNLTQVINDRLDNMESLVKKPHNSYRQNGSKQYKKEYNNA